MEVGLESAMSTYSGGLGVLAGDALRAAADLGISTVGVSLLHRKGYFTQQLDDTGVQTETPVEWWPERFLDAAPLTVKIELEGRDLHIRAWCYTIQGASGHTVPVYFLDTDVPGNTEWDRTLTDRLYGGDEHYRLAQEAVLGLGGVAMLRAIGHRRVETYHMNEGHSSLLALALLEEHMAERRLHEITDDDVSAVNSQCVFTTHTPVAAGHDKFTVELARTVLGDTRLDALIEMGCCPDEELNMTFVALFFSRYINGVSMRHEEVSQGMYPTYSINGITNGVHGVTWASAPFQALFDLNIPTWRQDNLYMRYVSGVPLEEIQQAHALAKQDLLAEVERRTNERFDPTAFTIGFARRATAYKRADLLFLNPERLISIAEKTGPLQIIYGGKAHPADTDGKAVIQRIVEIAATMPESVRIVYLEDYDMAIAKLMISGVDLWLNTPSKPQEASGTSGMKAAMNGVPSLSILDGWWVEGHVEGVTGWSIEDETGAEDDPTREADSIYGKLEYLILPTFYNRPRAYAEIMRQTIALNGSFFNAQRMMLQYQENAYSVTVDTDDGDTRPRTFREERPASIDVAADEDSEVSRDIHAA